MASVGILHSNLEGFQSHFVEPVSHSRGLPIKAAGLPRNNLSMLTNGFALAYLTFIRLSHFSRPYLETRMKTVPQNRNARVSFSRSETRQQVIYYKEPNSGHNRRDCIGVIQTVSGVKLALVKLSISLLLAQLNSLGF